ncbi:hypothetical protein [Streptomyces fragilis]|nr:hypothetical protein [Streptomyces fragilis]
MTRQRACCSELNVRGPLRSAQAACPNEGTGMPEDSVDAIEELSLIHI